MNKTRSKSKALIKPDWATKILGLRERLNLSQTTFGQEVRSSAMGVSRWERGAQEPPSHSYIELGNLAGDPDCWFFWERAGFHSQDLMRVMPKLRKRLRNPMLRRFQIVQAGSGGRKPKQSQLVAIPLLKVVAGTPGEKGDNLSVFHDAPVESMIAAPRDWCPNPDAMNCVRVKGSSMTPLIHNGYILAVDSSQISRDKLNGKIVIAWNKDAGLTVSRFQRYDHTEVLHPENNLYESITLDRKNKWKILGKVLWWIAKAP